MTSLRSLLAIDMKLAVKIALIVLAAILVLAFIVGIVKGFRKVGKAGLLWATAGGLFVLVYHFLGEKNLLASILKGKLASFSGMLWAFLVVAGCIGLAIALAAMCKYIFRPIPEDRVRRRNISEDGEEYPVAEVARLERDDLKPTPHFEEGYLPPPKYKKLGFWGRLFGGFISLFNLASILGIVALFAITIVLNSRFSGYLDPLLAKPILAKGINFASRYILDVATIGIVMCVAYKGFNTGFVGTTRIVFRQLGMVVALVAGLVLPFLRFFADLSIIQKVVGKLASFLPAWGMVSDILARLILGVMMAAVLMLLMALLNMLLKKLTYRIDDTKVIRVIDSIIASIVYLVLGAVLCVALWGVLFLVDYVGLIGIKDTLMKTPSFSRECFSMAEKAFSYVANNYLSKFVMA